MDNIMYYTTSTADPGFFLGGVHKEMMSTPSHIVVVSSPAVIRVVT